MARIASDVVVRHDYERETDGISWKARRGTTCGRRFHRDRPWQYSRNRHCTDLRDDPDLFFQHSSGLSDGSIAVASMQLLLGQYVVDPLSVDGENLAESTEPPS
jgi:hypothetical protein